MGITDRLEEAGVRTFGPNMKCSQLEASKSFTKEFLQRHGIPTAGIQGVHLLRKSLLSSLGIFGYPMVLKADGLAAGKGVVIAGDRGGSGEKAIEEMMGERVFGDPPRDKVVVEEFLTGSRGLHALLCRRENHSSLWSRLRTTRGVYDGDRGPEHGRNGDVFPEPGLLTPELEEADKRAHT